jgi:hypothetical protein
MTARTSGIYSRLAAATSNEGNTQHSLRERRKRIAASAWAPYKGLGRLADLTSFLTAARSSNVSLYNVGVARLRLGRIATELA